MEFNAGLQTTITSMLHNIIDRYQTFTMNSFSEPLILIQNQIFFKNQPKTMDEFFQSNDQPANDRPYQPPVYEQQEDLFADAPGNYQPNQPNPVYEFMPASALQPSTTFGTEQTGDNDFNDFQEDDVTRRIREEQERFQILLREKSEREWQEKLKRKQQGSLQLNDFNSRKEQQKNDRAAENVRRQTENKEALSKLNIEAGWRKVIQNINVRQGEHKGPKDTNRMRQAILHRREDS